jgi:acyl-CoA dehydrogenase
MDCLNIDSEGPDQQFPALRAEVRTFLRKELGGLSSRDRAQSWTGFDRNFSLALGAKGWIGMTWPMKYGGRERSPLERYVVLEELLAAGAPVAAHWMGDRQSGPLLLRYASESIKSSLLPKIALGEICFCIGMSETGSGSDLASVRSRATRTDDGWVLQGAKIWTTHANRSQYMIALFRTGAVDSGRSGLSQFLIDMDSPGVQIRPIRNLLGEDHFCEVFLDQVRLPFDHLLGAEGEGWRQVTEELALERSGPERYLSSIQLLIEMIRAGTAGDSRQAVGFGTLIAEMTALRQLSLRVAAKLTRGEDVSLLAAIVKDQGSLLEQKIPEVAYALFGTELMTDDVDLRQTIDYVTRAAPSFSLRGGTREILRGIIAKGVGLR